MPLGAMGEGSAFANQIAEVLKSSGWTVDGPNMGMYTGGDPVGFGMAIHSAATAFRFAVKLQQAFFAVGIPLPGGRKTGCQGKPSSCHRWSQGSPFGSSPGRQRQNRTLPSIATTVHCLPVDFPSHTW